MRRWRCQERRAGPGHQETLLSRGDVLGSISLHGRAEVEWGAPRGRSRESNGSSGVSSVPCAVEGHYVILRHVVHMLPPRRLSGEGPGGGR